MDNFAEFFLQNFSATNLIRKTHNGQMTFNFHCFLILSAVDAKI